jgi:micrococcal nuclease
VSRPLLLLAVLSLLFTFVSGAAAFLAESSLAQSGLAARGEIYTVERVVDGDTIEVDRPIQGEDNVRLIGIDTPETVDPGEPVQPLGPEASEFTTQQLEGQEVALEFGEERIDSFGRPLAYVWSSGSDLFNETLVREGLAQVATFPPNTKYEERFLAAQEEARDANLGIWGLSTEEQCQLANFDNGIGEGSPECSGATTSPEPEPEPEPTQGPAESEEPDPAQTEQPSPGEEPDPAQTEQPSPGEEPRPPEQGNASPAPPGSIAARETPETGGLALLPLAGMMMTAGFTGLLVARIRL